MTREDIEKNMHEAAEEIKPLVTTLVEALCDAHQKGYLAGVELGAKMAYPQWIPVEEQLPPPYCSNGSISDFVLTYNGYDVVKGYYDFMQNNWHNENYKVMEFDVTHWMEIVPPRKEDKK